MGKPVSRDEAASDRKDRVLDDTEGNRWRGGVLRGGTPDSSPDSGSGRSDVGYARGGRVLTPLTKGGTRTTHAGKGSKSASMGAHRDITAPPGSAPAGLNDYGKSSGQAAPAPTGLGSGTWPGIGG